jgi:hypothetical protein
LAVRKHFVVGLVVLVASGCQSLVEDLPDSGPAPSQGVVSSGPVGAATPAPTATPTNSPATSTPVPAEPTEPPSQGGGPGGPPPWQTACNLPPVSGVTTCGREGNSPQFATVVDNAITKLVKQHPEIFDLKRQQGVGEYFVKDWDAFFWGVMQNVGAAGYCANFDGENIGVKNSNGFNEGYHVLISNSFLWRPPQSWIGTCTPSWF